MNTRAILPEDLQALFESALLAPTSFNLQHWQFIVLDDDDKINTAMHFAKNWELDFRPEKLVVICANLDIWQEADKFAHHLPEEHWHAATQKATMVYGSSASAQRAEACRSCGFATTNLIWKASQLEIGHRLILGIDDKALGEMIELPSSHIITGVLALDFRIPLMPWKNQIDLSSQLITNGW